MSWLRERRQAPQGLQLEGLLEGNILDGAAWLESLRPWQRPPAFPADLDISTRGNRFSILFVPREDARGDDASEARIAEALADLLRGAPPGSLKSVTSSVRSTRTTPSASILTVYQVDDSGMVRTAQRESAPPIAPAPPTLLHRLRHWPAALGLLAVAAFGVWQLAPLRFKVQDTLGLSPPVPALAGSAFDRYLKAEILPGPPQALRLARLPAYPRDPASLDAAAAAAVGLHEMLALSSLGRGYIRCEWYDDAGVFLYGADLRVRELGDQEMMVHDLPVVPGAVSLRLLY